jgi:hypothetical protein
MEYIEEKIKAYIKNFNREKGSHQNLLTFLSNVLLGRCRAFKIVPFVPLCNTYLASMNSSMFPFSNSYLCLQPHNK